MVRWDVRRPAASALLLTKLGAESGVATRTCLRGSGVTAEQLEDPSTELTAAQELTITRNLLDALGHPEGLGLRAGARYHLTTHGIWGFALISSPTLRSAIDVGLRFLDLTYSYCRIEVREGERGLLLVLAAPDVPVDLRRFAVERDVAAIRTLQSDLLAEPVALHGVRFAFPPPSGSVDRYAELCGVRPEFGCAENVVEIDPVLLDAPLPQADEHSAALMRQQCRELLERRQQRAGLAGQVREHVLARMSSPPGRAEMAAALHISERTLHRRLAEEGTSYRDVLNDARAELAEDLLSTAGLPVAEVARRLGYVEVTSFSQAFRRWKGVGPRTFRGGIAPRKAP
ncbi:transcriptional regulator, AraC family [Haloechinothrix alba]|uniref:Transcriptional regulator, AraC family n=1 Tax=Haloechinothrix alba TaxID=664784 RepID=A0A238VQ08_9PSEU|nr:AraC family transcriptional regulator [Haloechinothrix alba]SNR36452.1 transcriptional regulator, AraC family [Haloechinothrix alba]